ncbi:hypothetical protein SRS16CHR_05006 [Variovorax sp. SRS16]|uniref:hypothetical protein n=1 Tax=Variovorax sp. SRS16 TaxID=282217 RepID=UPI0013179667|nr:hypothetical protein [Variovorax sp. SRS16]VTU32035.1 hypothetical protein SRS16CHR_05006 [Variovorax sp. SRS16]
MTPELWPPLNLIRGMFARDASDDGAPGHGDTCVAWRPSRAAAAPRPNLESLLLLPLTELARRREAVARRAFAAHWAPGRLVGVTHEGRLFGVLLDRRVQGALWRGWMAAGEADWAGAFDVLLEPGDEPFEPMFGMVQAWNLLTLEEAPPPRARVLGELSATRLAAVRAVHDEWAAQQAPAIAPEPGRIALRNAGGAFSVLSGTPLGEADPRTDYQDLYREAAARLAVPAPADPAPRSQAVVPLHHEGWWTRTRRWFAADALVRPALAVLALVVVVQNAALLRVPDAGDADDVQFRSVPTDPAEPLSADLVVQWKKGIGLDEANALLAATGAVVVGGPDAQGRWRVHLVDVAQGQALLAASPLVESVGAP